MKLWQTKKYPVMEYEAILSNSFIHLRQLLVRVIILNP